MNNLYRELAPVTDVAWAEIELEASRTFKRHIAGRRVVDVSGPSGPTTAAVSTGHLNRVSPPSDGVIADLRDSRPLVRLRVPFTVTREAIDDVERGAQDSDWDPVKEAAQKLAWAEDRATGPLTVADLAARAGMSPANLHRRFRAELGCTPNQWLTAVRVEHARRLLETTDLAVDRIAHRSGLGTAANLRTRLAEQTGLTPTAYRRTYQSSGFGTAG